ncbi:MAG: hypothetical protein ACI978_001599 [Oleispira sp.]
MELTLGTDFILRLFINTCAVVLLIRFCYYKFSQHRANASSFILFGMGVFLVTSLLHSADVSMGFAFGLFAVFSMLRYRTESISIKEMTYLFLVIAIALLSAVSTLHPYELLTITLSICLMTYVLETNLVLPSLDEIEIDYEKIENINTNRREELITDLKMRTGLDVQQIEILSIDFLRDSSRLKVQFKPTIKGNDVTDNVLSREHHA